MSPVVGQLAIWDESDILDSVSAIIVKETELENFKGYLNEGLIPKTVETVFLIIDSNIKIIPILSVFLGLKYSYVTDIKYDESTKIIDTWSRLILRRPYEHIDSDILVNGAYLIEVIEEVFDFYSKMLTVSPLGKMNKSLFNDKWWERPFEINHSISSLLSKVNRLTSSKLKDDLIEQLLFWRSMEQTYVNLLVSKKFIFASAFCFMSAKFAIDSNDYDKGMLLIHRSIELYLISIAIEYGIIRPNSHGLRYIHNSRLVGFSNTLNELNNCQELIFSESDICSIESINITRNKSLLTHSLYSVIDSEVYDMHKFVYEFIKKSSENWLTYLNSFSKNFTLQVIDIFENEDSFEENFQMISVEELACNL